MSVSVNLLLITVAVNLLIQCSAQFPPRDDDMQVCQENARGRDVMKGSKAMRMDCNVNCEYSDGNTESYNSKDNQLCCKAGGLPTGRCDNGDCPPGKIQ